MQKIKQFLITNRMEIFSVASLFVIFALMMSFYGKHLGNIVIDCGREAYFPMEMLKGKILYRDLLNVLGPLSYQLNALFYMIFGVSLDTLRLAGMLNSIIIISLLYAIARFFTSRGIAWTVILFVMTSCVFSTGLFNYIYPYAYAIVYALSAFLFSVLFLMLYLKSSRQFFIPLSWFFLGISIACKYEYFLYAVFLALLTMVFAATKKLSVRYVFCSIISFLVVPVVSYSILLFQGLTIRELIAQVQLIRKFTLSPTLNYFYANLVGLYPQKGNLILAFGLFKSVFVNLILLLTALYFYFKFIDTNDKKIKNALLSLVFVGFFLYNLFSCVAQNLPLVFCWLPLFTLLIFGVMVVRLIKYKNYFHEGLYTIFIFIALVASVKSFFYLNFNAYGTFAFPLLFIVNVIFVVECLPKYYKFINKKHLKKAFVLILLGLSTLYFGGFVLSCKNDDFVKTPMGEIYNPKAVVKTINESIDFINKKMQPSSSFLVMPEGIMLNFLTNHPSETIYYSLHPPTIDLFGEDKIIEDIKKDSPDYIFINNRDSWEFGTRYMCEDYGFKICDYVKSEYVPVAEFGSEFKMILYKNMKNDVGR